MRRYADLLSEILDELESVLQAVEERHVASLMERIMAAERLFLTGKGRSGLAMRAFAMRLMHLGLRSHFVGDVTTPGIAANDLLLVGSGSGRTASVLEYARQAQRLGAELALITADPESPIAEQASLVLVIPAPTPKAGNSRPGRSIQPMGSLFEQALWLLCDVLVLDLMERIPVSAEEMFSRHANLE
jgi:6-phospho-3-hexuloisomerase